LIERVGLYDTDFGPGSRFIAEDSDFIYRAWKAGYKLIYVPSLFVYHDHGRRTPAAALALRRGYIFGRGGFYAKHIIGGDKVALQGMYWEILWSLKNQRFKTFSRDLLWLLTGFTSYCLIRGVRLITPDFARPRIK